jgi:hypothetical protein
MAGFTYRLYLESGDDIGTFTTAVPDWNVGMEFISGDHVTFRILNIVPELDEGEFAGMFVVTPVQLAEP